MRSDGALQAAAAAQALAPVRGFVSVRGLAKSFATPGQPPLCVLRDVDLEIAGGEFLTVIGPSGCGKSTLLHVLAGFDTPSAGEARVDGRAVIGAGLDRMVVFQSFALMPWLSAEGNVRMAVRAAYPDWPRARVREHTASVLAQMGLAGSEHKRPALLSGGMRQRVGLARAFAVQPKVLLLDEPFAQIDALTRGVIQDELMRMQQATRATVFMVTHDVDEAILLSDRIALMTPAPEASIAEILDVPLARPRVREALVETPAYARLRARILHFLLHAMQRRTRLPTGVGGAGDPETRGASE